MCFECIQFIHIGIISVWLRITNRGCRGACGLNIFEHREGMGGKGGINFKRKWPSRSRSANNELKCVFNCVGTGAVAAGNLELYSYIIYKYNPIKTKSNVKEYYDMRTIFLSNQRGKMDRTWCGRNWNKVSELNDMNRMCAMQTPVRLHVHSWIILRPMWQVLYTKRNGLICSHDAWRSRQSLIVHDRLASISLRTDSIGLKTLFHCIIM